ncbi:MAG: helix-turn-helix transcriptional regulator [Tenericutes bacterium]|nr:helix-turn-helix transcriptional regulator [Mycoplasmatota bacterium]
MEKKTRLKEIREQKGLSQREIAKMIDTSHTSISRYEKGVSMSDETIKKICRALEINADYFLGLVDNKKKD